MKKPVNELEESCLELQILYRDKDYVAIHKPSGMVVHPSRIARDSVTCLNVLRDQLGQYVYPVHRLDRGTCGIVLFGLSPEAARSFAAMLQEHGGAVFKVYLAITRGWIGEGMGLIDKPLRENRDKDYVEARTKYFRLATTEIQSAVGRYPTARYSLVRLLPETGRQHQLRKHLASLAHPIVGDSQYGDRDHNRFIAQKFEVQRLLLSAIHLSFTHPKTGSKVEIRSEPSKDFQTVRIGLFGEAQETD